MLQIKTLIEQEENEEDEHCGGQHPSGLTVTLCCYLSN